MVVKVLSQDTAMILATLEGKSSLWGCSLVITAGCWDLAELAASPTLLLLPYTQYLYVVGGFSVTPTFPVLCAHRDNQGNGSNIGQIMSFGQLKG